MRKLIWFPKARLWPVRHRTAAKIPQRVATAAWARKYYGMFTARHPAERLPATIVAVTQLVMATIWLSAPSSSIPAARDFEECAAWAQKMSQGTERVARIMDCGARFAARRKAGGGYAYYDLMQNRSFDIAGPNPTADERTRIYSQYVHFLDSQRREAALAEVDQLATEKSQVETPSHFRSPTTKPAKQKACLIEGSLSCTWVKLTSTVRKAFASNSRAEGSR